MDTTEQTVLTIDSDYAYIGTFILFLERLIKIIKDLFSGISLGKKEEATAAPAAE